MPIVLFLNKMDLFKIKMDNKINITDAFPDYDGECDEEKCFEYISHYFKDISQQMYSDRLIFNHGASAIDRNILIQIWDIIANSIILPAAMHKSGMDTIDRGVMEGMDDQEDDF